MLGNLKLIDQGEVDHKILVLGVHDPLAQKVSNLEELEKERPGLVAKLVEWLIMYKTTDGKPKNKLASHTPDSAAEALKTVEETHQHWKKLVEGKTANSQGFHLVKGVPPARTEL